MTLYNIATTYWPYKKYIDLRVGYIYKDHWIYNLYEVVVEGSEVDIVEKIKKV